MTRFEQQGKELLAVSIGIRQWHVWVLRGADARMIWGISAQDR